MANRSQDAAPGSAATEKPQQQSWRFQFPAWKPSSGEDEKGMSRMVTRINGVV
jgi:hypothetical protein